MNPKKPVQLSENAMTVLSKRYLFRDRDGTPLETPEQFFMRVARHVAEGDSAYGASKPEIEATCQTFYELLSSLTFLPNSPTLMNAGREKGQLSACFVLPIEDSMVSIFDTLKHTALIHQSGGGTGFSFSRLRPRGDAVKSTMGESSGPVSFMEVYNAATEAIKQGGTRRGANMGILKVDHPDIEEFIRCKSDLGRVTNFNISVGITDQFMEAVANGSDFDLIHPGTKQVVRSINAQELMNQIIESAWQTGEPGLVFLDRINRDNPTPAVGVIEATNPCGEVPLLPYEACNLGSINLGKMLNASGEFDWELLAVTVQQSVHFLDNVITQNHFPLPEIQKMVEGNRKIGLGVMGWADLLFALEIPYDSEEAVALGQEVMAWIDYHSKQTSVDLAKKRGAFPNFSKSRYASGTWLQEKHVHSTTTRITKNQWQSLDAEITNSGIRNATTTCIAPTGTISMIADASGGIEPIFSLAYFRNVMDGTKMSEVHNGFKAVLEAKGIWSAGLKQEIATHGSLDGVKDVPDKIRQVFVTARDVAPNWHVKMQAAFQAYTDNAVSKTINFAESATRHDVAETYRLADELGVKGITVYRDNSRKNQPMHLQTETTEPQQIVCADC